MPELSRPKLHISDIGAVHFSVGVILGLSFATILSLLFNYASELLRYKLTLKYGLYTFVDPDFWLIDLSFSLVSTALGLVITCAAWCSSPKMMKRLGFKKVMRKFNSLFFLFWLFVFVLGEFYKFLFISYGTAAFEHEYFAFYRHMWVVYFILAATLFLMCWSTFRRSFRLGAWIPSSGLACFLMAIILAGTTTVSPLKLNNAYLSSFEYEHSIIEEELIRAEEKYEIRFSDHDNKSLKQWRGKDALAQMEFVQQQFGNDDPVEMTTIIVQKILLRIGKNGRSDRRDSWAHAYPDDILRQLSYFESGDPERSELFHILRNLMLVSNQYFDRFPDSAPFCDLSFMALKPNYHLENNDTFDLFVDQLAEIRQGLLSDTSYAAYHHLLPELTMGYVFEYSEESRGLIR